MTDAGAPTSAVSHATTIATARGRAPGATIRRAAIGDARAIAHVRIDGWRATRAAVAAAQRRHGASGLLTWVIAANRGARAFYESLGAELVVEQRFQWDGLDLIEAGYGWRNLDAPAAACARRPRRQ